MFIPAGQCHVYHYKLTLPTALDRLEAFLGIGSTSPHPDPVFSWLFASAVRLTHDGFDVVFTPRDYIVGGADDPYRLDSDEPFIAGGNS